MNVIRRLLLQSGALLAWTGRADAQNFLPPQDIRPLIDMVTKGRAVQAGRVTIELPVIAENGNSVPLTLTVQSAMSRDDYVKALYVYAPRNPRPLVAGFHLSPANGRAVVTTRIRLAVTQRVIAIATLSDGSFWSGEANVAVTAAACLDEAL